MKRYFGLTLLLIAVCLSHPSFAQINPFRGGRGTPLNAADLSALGDATTRLLDRPQLAVGDSETWSNPDSGVNGTATAGATTQRKGLACRIVNYQATVPGSNPQRSARLTWCKTQDGWKLG